MTSGYSGADSSCWYVIEVRLPGSTGADALFLAILCNSLDIPLTNAGRLILFDEFAAAETIIRRFSESGSDEGMYVNEVSCVCDVSKVLQLVKSQERDESATIVNCMNTMLDVLRVLPVAIPDTVKQCLHRVADYCTFEKDLTELFAQAGTSRVEIFDSLMWCCGVIATNIHIVRSSSSNMAD